MLIVSAHSDDCVIMGAEMAWGVVRDGGHVRIAYMTCSAADPREQIAQVRAQEARTAWRQQFGDCVSFQEANLPQSVIGGAANYASEDLERFVDLLAQMVAKLSERAIVLIPAARETHIDHENARLAAIRAVKQSGRNDIQLVETAEYNEILSMRHDPIRVVCLLLAEFPIFRGMLPRRSVSPAFFGGPAGRMYSDTEARLAAKISMLGAFASQSPTVLCHYFSWASKYRPVWPDRKAFSFRIFRKTADSSVFLFMGLCLLTIATASLALAKTNSVIGSVALVFGVVLLVVAVVRQKWIPSVVASAIVFGVVAGAVL
ncbi:PIG-L family deacetylase [Loktanella sp. 5RATIMAR09]|uniref:PIG-L deacetylase family protein n=1 Tax=Loktanella sp. 5RATIMAR09 TaxID=1225655 RepID=UPI001C11D4FD|nr:PIG-L family deacetylase [Loktanella sp. 5RATIMAR09]